MLSRVRISIFIKEFQKFLFKGIADTSSLGHAIPNILIQTEYIQDVFNEQLNNENE